MTSSIYVSPNFSLMDTYAIYVLFYMEQMNHY